MLQNLLFQPRRQIAPKSLLAGYTAKVNTDLRACANCAYNCVTLPMFWPTLSLKVINALNKESSKDVHYTYKVKQIKDVLV